MCKPLEWCPPAVLPRVAVDAETPLSHLKGVLWMGTHVISGTGKALVVKTGKQTEFGKVSERLKLRPQETEFERGSEAIRVFSHGSHPDAGDRYLCGQNVYLRRSGGSCRVPPSVTVHRAGRSYCEEVLKMAESVDSYTCQ